MGLFRLVEKLTISDGKKISEIRKELQINNITDENKNSRENWQYQVERMAIDRLLLQVYLVFWMKI